MNEIALSYSKSENRNDLQARLDGIQWFIDKIQHDYPSESCPEPYIKSREEVLTALYERKKYLLGELQNLGVQ